MSKEKDEITIPIENINLNGILTIPKQAQSLVIFAHGSGSSRFSTRNQYVAQILNKVNIGSLLFDLLTDEEEIVDNLTAEHRFNIKLLSTRLTAVTKWTSQNPHLNKLAIGYFGASTGSSAALMACAKKSNIIKAVVSRGGRPDLAMDCLSKVKAPTLLIVGGDDEVVIDLNQQAMKKLLCTTKLEIVPNATHLFEEPGALDIVACLAKEWFTKYLI